MELLEKFLDTMARKCAIVFLCLEKYYFYSARKERVL